MESEYLFLAHWEMNHHFRNSNFNEKKIGNIICWLDKKRETFAAECNVHWIWCDDTRYDSNSRNSK